MNRQTLLVGFIALAVLCGGFAASPAAASLAQGNGHATAAAVNGTTSTTSGTTTASTTTTTTSGTTTASTTTTTTTTTSTTSSTTTTASTTSSTTTTTDSTTTSSTTAASTTSTTASTTTSSSTTTAGTTSDPSTTTTSGATTTASASVQSSCSYPFSRTDATGTTVTLDSAPRRIVVVGPSATQTVWEVGARHRVVGIWKSSSTTYLDNASAKANVAGSYGYAEPEAVLNRSPDLVLLANIQKNATARTLRQAGVTVYKFRASENVSDIEAKTRLVGRLVGSCAGASDTVDRMNERLRAVDRVRARASATPSMYYPMSGGYTAGKGSFISDVMARAGAHNAALNGDFSASYPQPSEEFVVQQNPDWLLATYTGSSAPADPKRLVPQTQAVTHTAAYRRGNVVAVNANYLSQPAPRVVYAIENITKALHPKAWRAVHGSSSTPVVSVGGGGGGGGGDWGASDTGTTTTTTTPASNNSESPAPATASLTATVRNATGNVSVTFADAPGNATNASARSANATAVTGASVTLSNGTTADSLTLSASAPTAAPPNGTATLSSGHAVRYFTLNATGVADANVTRATLRFDVNASDLPAGVTPSDVVLYRNHGGTWRALPTEHLNASAYAATTPGFSTYAIAANDTAATGNATTTTAATGRTTTGDTTGTTASATAATTTTPSTSSSASPGFGPAVAFVGLLAAALVARRRR